MDGGGSRNLNTRGCRAPNGRRFLSHMGPSPVGDLRDVGIRAPSQTIADPPISRPRRRPACGIDSQQIVSQCPASLDVHEIGYS